MKKTKTKLFAFALAAVAALACLAGCRGNASTNGSYRLRDSNGDKSYTVMFELSNPSRPLGDGVYETTAYLRLVGMYVTARKADSDTGKVGLRLERCVAQDNPVEPFGATYWFDGTLENKNSHLQRWYTPFLADLSDDNGIQAGNLHITSYKYWRLRCTGGDLYLDEVVFIGEVLTGKDGTGTGEYSLVPAVIHTATPHGEETQARANQKAKILLDGQPSSVAEVIK